MSHVVRIRLDSATAPSDADTRIGNWKESHRPILEDDEITYRTVTDIDDTELYDEALVRFDIRDDLQPIVDDLEAAFVGDVDWLLIETQTDDREWNDAAYRDDPDYYPPGWTDEHRTPPELTRQGLWEVGVSDTNYLIGGTEISAAGTTISVDASDSGVRTDVIAVTDSGTVEHLTATGRGDLPADKLVAGELEVHPGKVVIIDREEISVTTTDWTTAVEDGTAPDDAK